MSEQIEVKRFKIKCNDEDFLKITSFFKGGDWYALSEDGRYERKRTSVNINLSREGGEVFIDVWAIGGFGEVLPEKNAIFGMLNTQIIRKVQNEIADFLNTRNIDYQETHTTIFGKSQKSSWLIIAVIILLGVLTMFVFFPYKK